MTRLRKAQAMQAALTGLAGAAIAFTLFTACAADPNTSSTSPTPSASQTADEATLVGAHISFNFNDYYTLTSPYAATSCAGDLKNYYDPMTGQAYAQNSIDSTQTLRPAFIKNVSVDMTDAGTPAASNGAFACSYGDGSNAPPVSGCATFDYGAIDGIPTSLGGALLVFGGTLGSNYAGVGRAPNCTIDSTGTTSTFCFGGTATGSMFALGVDTLPASAAGTSLAPNLTSGSTSGKISSWAALSYATGYTGPPAAAGASVAYDPGTRTVLLYGGAQPYAGNPYTEEGFDTGDTWTYDLNAQKWTQVSANYSMASSIAQTTDVLSASNTVTWQKDSGARAIFGYASQQGAALQAMSANGAGAVSNADVDPTDRIFIVGGYGPANYCGTGTQADSLCDTRKLNPTFGPDWVDAISTEPNAAHDFPVEWMDSAPIQLMNGAQTTGGAGLFDTAELLINFGMAAVRDNTNGQTAAAYPISAGGFTYASDTTVHHGGGKTWLDTRDGTQATEGDTVTFLSLPSLIDPLGIGWANYTLNANSSEPHINNRSSIWGGHGAGSAFQDSITPVIQSYGGSTLLPGFDENANDLVYFGGADCKQYLSGNSSYLSNCHFDNPGAYLSLTDNFVNNWAGTGDLSTYANSIFTVDTSPGTNQGDAPPCAGMAAARGLDNNGNVTIVAFGGQCSNGSNDLYLYYLYNQNGTTPTWHFVSLASLGTTPAPVINGALVYSHATNAFYLFGGYSSTAGLAIGDTWKLTLSGCDATLATATCAFAWTKLNGTNSTGSGLTCYPNCPSARRSHRMVEANYYNYWSQNPAGTPSGEQTCSSTAPCSYGIFMEGGTTDGLTMLSDRWMFDPTANDGWGNWQLVGDFPPRTLASMAAVDYALPFNGTTAHRAILFGGETALQDPTYALTASSKYFVPPTLGDTWMYDFDKKTWNRVRLLGKGYNGTGGLGTATEVERRQAYDATAPSVGAGGATWAELSPPALSGAMMVTRTMSGATLGASSPPTPLAIPEVYLIGGRKKNGSYNDLTGVWKFCAGSTGESDPPVATSPGPNDFTCDAYNASANSSSTSPSSDYVGRWLHKAPDCTGAGCAANGVASALNVGAYLGAATYDSYRDLVVVFGGMTCTGAGCAADAMTDSTSAAKHTATSLVYEYTPPEQAGAYDGTWNAIGACTATAPTPRYGHALYYDSLNNQLVVVGGYSGATNIGNTLVDSSGNPEVWTAKRDDTAATPCYTWTQVTTWGSYQGTSPSVPAQAAPPGALAHMASVYIQGSGFNTGYYSMYDSSCVNDGPISSSDPSISKLLAGGVYFDIDRTQLGPRENLLLNLTYFPLGQDNVGPDGTPLTLSEAADFKVHLIRTGQTGDTIRGVLQPRYMTYADTTNYPKVAPNLATLAPPSGQIMEMQVLIPLSIDPTIDRIRIERYSGSGILIDASLYRMGYR